MNESGLVRAYVFNGAGGAAALDWDGIARWQPADGVMWVHLNRDSGDARSWLHERSGLDPVVAEALLTEEPRPRCVQIDDGVMLFLRGVNLNPNADPEDMVSIRLWFDETRIISVRLRRLLSVNDLAEALETERGPRSVGEFIVELADRLLSRMAGVIADIDDVVDEIQEKILTGQSHRLRTEQAHLRREVIALRRYLAPQREALGRLAQLRAPWFDEELGMQLREEVDRVTRYVEDLDAARERAAVSQEELTNRLAEQMNNRMYTLSVVAAVFLPLGFLTGLLGINVGGIPLADDPWGFAEVVVILIVITTLEVLIFRWRRWF